MWELQKDLRVLLQLEFERDRDVRVRQASTSYAAAQEILLANYSIQDFLGNLLPTILRLLQIVRFSMVVPKRATSLVRRRGYRDHGSLRPSHQKLERFDAELTEEQLRIEADRQSRMDTDQFLQGFMGLV
jgi:glycine/D-amino acid oxidase-like deaminating enzyme